MTVEESSFEIVQSIDVQVEGHAEIPDCDKGINETFHLKKVTENIAKMKAMIWNQIPRIGLWFGELIVP